MPDDVNLDSAAKPYWFRVTQILSGREGAWIARGPFKTYDEAKAARERVKRDYDMRVGNVFAAATREEAEKSVL